MSQSEQIRLTYLYGTLNPLYLLIGQVSAGSTYLPAGATVSGVICDLGWDLDLIGPRLYYSSSLMGLDC